MKTKIKLIAIYLYVCDSYTKHLSLHFQRMSNNNSVAFSDQELLSIYLFCTLQGYRQVRAMYDHIKDDWLDWFPQLPSYQAFNRRLNELHQAFIVLANDLLAEVAQDDICWDMSLVDSMPIMLAKSGRVDDAKVARELADKGYCSTKKMFYHGVKLHVVGFRQRGSIPVPEYIGISEAAAHDLTVLHSILPQVKDRHLFMDKIYADAPLAQHVQQEQGCYMHTPVKTKRGQKDKGLDAAQRGLSAVVSTFRQPIESFFNWLNEKTAIQDAAKVRSAKGLLIHVFGKIAAALYAKAFKQLYS